MVSFVLLCAIIYWIAIGGAFESENIDSLRDCILEQLLKKWEPDDIYRQYRDIMSTEYFQESYRDIYYKIFHL